MNQKVFKFSVSEAYFLRLDYGAELISQLVEFLKSKGISSAYVSGVGAVTSAEVGYYDQVKREYVKRSVDERCEIVSLSGNISIKDGEPFPHLHVALGYNGKVYVGHLFSAKVFACELFVLPLEGEAPSRHYDEQTGLFLWES